MDAVFKIGNSHLVVAFFHENAVIDKLRLEYSEGWEERLSQKFQVHQNIKHVFIGSVNHIRDEKVVSTLNHFSIPKIAHFNTRDISIEMCVDNPEEVGSDLIANVYGALKLFPQKNIIVLDFGTAISFDIASKDRKFLGAVIMPGLGMGAKGLYSLTDKLPLVTFKKPTTCLGKNTEACIQSGLYWGVLGSVEKILKELKREVFPDNEVFVVATGGITSLDSIKDGYIPKHQSTNDFRKDLETLVDAIEPDLTLLGLYEILKEQIK